MRRSRTSEFNIRTQAISGELVPSTVFYVGGFELPDRNAAAHRVVSNSKILRQLGYHVILIGVRSEPEKTGIRRDADHYGFECYSVPYPRSVGDWFRYTWGCSGILELIQSGRFENAVAGIFYNYPALAQLRFSAACKRRGTKHISDATEWYDASGGSLLFRVAKWFDTTLRMRWVHRRACGVITTSKVLTERYAVRGMPVTELPTLYDADAFEQPPQRRDSSIRKFIYVGNPFDAARVNRRRTNVKERLDRCIRVFFDLHEESHEFEFSIIGVDRETYLRVYPEDAARLESLGDKLKFTGRVDHAEVLRKVSSSDVTVFFRDRTRVTMAGFPSKLAESITCGTPVVTNAMPMLERYRGTDGLFLVEYADAADAIRRLIEMTGREVETLKVAAWESRAFDYRGYVDDVGRFLDDVGVRGRNAATV